MTARVLAALAATALTAAVAVVQPVGVAPAAAASANAVDTTSRAAVEQAYLTRWEPARTTAVASSADTARCLPGSTTSATVSSTFAAWNFARGLAGLDAVTSDPALADAAQRAALVLSARDELSHNPPSSWPCWSDAAATGARTSNIGIAWGGRTPTPAEIVNGYLTERGDQGGNLGHRRWMLHPPLATSAVGVASNPATQSAYGTNTANAIRVVDVGTNPAATNPAWVPWPTSGWFPAQLEPDGLWSLTSSSPSADFSRATVTVTAPDGRALPVKVMQTATGYGNRTLAFDVDGVVQPTGSGEAVHTVTVSGMTGTAAPTYSYQVRLFLAGAPTLTAPAATTVEVGAPVTLQVQAGGTPAPTLSWQRSTNGGASYTTVPGATGSTYSFTATAADEGTMYRVVARNAVTTTTSAAARVTVVDRPTFVTQPRDTTFATGGTVTLDPGVVAAPGATYRWERRVGDSWAAVSGGTARVLTLTDLGAADDGAQLRLTVTSSRGATTSAVATLTLDDRSYVPVTPARVHDVRSGVVANAPACFPVTGPGTGVPHGATGVALNVTTVRPAGGGHVVVYPDTAGDGSTPAPETATVNFVPGSDVGNAAMIQVPPSGRVCYMTRGASTGVVVDLTGYYLPKAGITFSVPQRLEDRSGVAAGQVVTIPVAGRAGVPANATSVVLNVAVAGSRAAGNLRAWAAGAPAPPTSNVNYLNPGDRANAAVVALSADGKLSYRSDTASSNKVRVVLDVVGYTVGDSGYVPVTPARVLDTRETRRLAAGQQVQVTAPSSAPAGATAMVLNVAGVGPSSLGHLRVFPYRSGATPPVMSSLNYIPGTDGANLVVVGLGPDRRVGVYTDQSAGGSVDVVVDLVGYLVTPD